MAVLALFVLILGIIGRSSTLPLLPFLCFCFLLLKFLCLLCLNMDLLLLFYSKPYCPQQSFKLFHFKLFKLFAFLLDPFTYLRHGLTNTASRKSCVSGANLFVYFLDSCQLVYLQGWGRRCRIAEDSGLCLWSGS